MERRPAQFGSRLPRVGPRPLWQVPDWDAGFMREGRGGSMAGCWYAGAARREFSVFSSVGVMARAGWGAFVPGAAGGDRGTGDKVSLWRVSRESEYDGLVKVVWNVSYWHFGWLLGYIFGDL